MTIQSSTKHSEGSFGEPKKLNTQPEGGYLSSNDMLIAVSDGTKGLCYSTTVTLDAVCEFGMIYKRFPTKSVVTLTQDSLL